MKKDKVKVSMNFWKAMHGVPIELTGEDLERWKKDNAGKITRITDPELIAKLEKREREFNEKECRHDEEDRIR